MSDHRPRASSSVTIRSFQRSDQSECVRIFTSGYQEFSRYLHIAVLKTVLWHSVIVTLFASLAAILWSTWMLAVGSVFVLSLVIYPVVKLQRAGFFRFMNNVLENEFKDIEKAYMCGDGCHLWVAEWNGKIVGMVGLIRTDSRKRRFAELQRMSVVPSWRGMGIGKKLLNELIAFAKRHGIEEIVLAATSTQIPAIRLYKKQGFKLVGEINVFGDITTQFFKMLL